MVDDLIDQARCIVVDDLIDHARGIVVDDLTIRKKGFILSSMGSSPVITYTSKKHRANTRFESIRHVGKLHNRVVYLHRLESQIRDRRVEVKQVGAHQSW